MGKGRELEPSEQEACGVDEVTPATYLAPVGLEMVTRMIPHRDPMLLIDGIEEIDRIAKRIVAFRKVTEERDFFFRGHFPGFALMPGVLIVEAIAQAGACLCASLGAPSMNAPLVKIEEAKFRTPVRPGDTLKLEAEIEAWRLPMVKISGRALVGGRIVASATITAMMIDIAGEPEPR